MAAVVESHLIECSNQIIRVDDLDLKIFEPQSSARNLEVFEKMQNIAKMDYINKTIEITRGNKAEAARMLGVSPTHLQYLLIGSKASKKVKQQEAAEA